MSTDWITNTTLNCGNLAFPLSCPLPGPKPIDGHSGACYTLYFPVPTCNYNPPSDPSTLEYNPLLEPHQLTWQRIDQFYATNASSAALQGILLGMMIVTFVNIVVLTPERKRGLPVFVAITGSVAGEIVRGGIGVYLSIHGTQVSAYLGLTGLWDGTEWSGLWGGLVTVYQVVACGVWAGVHFAFWCQCRGLLVWVRIRYGRSWYRGVLGVLCGLAGVSWAWRVVCAVYQIHYQAFPKAFGLSTGWRLLDTLQTASLVSVGVSFGCWSLVFVISAGWILWDRRRGILNADFGGREDKVRRKFGKVCERALNLVAFVGVESFLIPFALSISAAVTTSPATEVLLVSVVLASLPLSSLLAQGNECCDKRQRSAGSPQFEMLSRAKVAGNTSISFSIQLENASCQPVSSSQFGQEDQTSANNSIDRELHEIDSVR